VGQTVQLRRATLWVKEAETYVFQYSGFSLWVRKTAGYWLERTGPRPSRPQR